MTHIEIKKANGLDLVYVPQWLVEDTCANILQQLLQLQYRTDDESAVLMYGKMTKIPRKQTAFADAGIVPYRFSGTSVAGSDWPEWLLDLKNILNDKLREWNILPVDGPRLNFCLVNLYQNGQDYIGWHSDKSTDLISIGPNQVHIIVSLSFGATRSFLFQSKETGKEFSLTLKSGDLLIMRGETNARWKHSLPKTPNLDDPRISLTFRIIKIDI